jgi:hypothetical protein
MGRRELARIHGGEQKSGEHSHGSPESKGMLVFDIFILERPVLMPEEEDASHQHSNADTNGKEKTVSRKCDKQDGDNRNGNQ